VEKARLKLLEKNSSHGKSRLLLWKIKTAALENQDFRFGKTPHSPTTRKRQKPDNAKGNSLHRELPFLIQ